MSLVWCLSFCFVSLFFFLTPTSRLAPMARTLLGSLKHAMFKFFVVAARMFLVFCVCPNFDDLAKQRGNIFSGVSEVGKHDFPVYFCRLCVFFLVFFSLLRSRATSLHVCLRMWSMKGGLICGTNEETGSQVSWDGP